LDLETSLAATLVEIEGVLPLNGAMKLLLRSMYKRKQQDELFSHRSFKRFFVIVRKASSTLVDSTAEVSMKGIPSLLAYAYINEEI